MTASDSPQPLPVIFHKMLRWYDANARDLVWRVAPAARSEGERPDPYRVWLSEIMLQQTGVSVVEPRFRRFLERFPTLQALAASGIEAVAAEWAGLGYYARLRNLHACARILTRDYGGIFPDTVEELEKLPGIGAYTARAIAAIAFDRQVVPADGNIARIVARLEAIPAETPTARTRLLRRAGSLVPGPRPGDFAQSLMDLGAGICTPRAPDCGACPIAGDCAAFRTGRPADFPGPLRRPKKPQLFGACFLLWRSRSGCDALLLRRRPDKGLLGGLWTAPMTDFVPKPPPVMAAGAPCPAAWESRGSLRHSFTHFDLELTVYEAALTDENGRVERAWMEGTWVERPALADIAMPSLMRKALDKARTCPAGTARTRKSD